MANTIFSCLIIDCCGCSTEEEGFNVCNRCHDNGKSCLNPSTDHKLLGRVTADWLVSWLDYTPHMTNAKVESPIKWSLDDVEGRQDENGDDDDNGDGSGRQQEKITPVRTIGREAVVYEEKGKGGAMRVQQVEELEKGAGCCKCVVQ